MLNLTKVTPSLKNESQDVNELNDYYPDNDYTATVFLYPWFRYKLQFISNGIKLNKLNLTTLLIGFNYYKDLYGTLYFNCLILNLSLIKSHHPMA